MSGTIAELRQLELHEGDHVAASIDNETTNESCCDRCSWKIRNAIPVSSIVDCLATVLTNSYDLLTILISIADVTTDIWVIYKFYIDKRETFFIIALIVMILAQLSYALAFVFRFEPRYNSYRVNGSRRLRRIKLFLFILPLTPVVSFLFFWCTVSPNNLFISFIDYWIDIQDQFDADVDPNLPKILIWIKKKLVKHMGFILEAMIEALPQSIIQLIAIVYYQDTELINIISICISLLSVTTKTMVFSFAIDFKVFIYNWLSLVCDFFGVFAIISWYELITLRTVHCTICCFLLCFISSFFFFAIAV